MKVILVSGTPGTGKTRYAKKLAREKGYTYIDVNKVISSNKLAEGYDFNRDTKIIDTSKLNKALIKLINAEKNKKTKGLVIDSHLSHYLPKKYADLCIITKCDLKELKKRLVKRGYAKEKVRENMDAEIFDTCKTEAQEMGHKVKVFFTDSKKY
jgi:broad-specificity NMP kinase